MASENDACRGSLTRCSAPVAKQPLPPQVICQILGMDEEVVKEAFDTGNVPSASEEQLFNAVKKSVDPEDTAETYAPVLAYFCRKARLASKRVMFSIASPI